MADVIDRFAGKYRFLSNFYPAPFSYAGILYTTNEHFFNANKTEDLAERRLIAAAATAAEAKRLGRTCQLRPGWDERVRYEVMGLGLRLKFADPTLRDLLLGTSDAWLVEGTTWHDTHWGICTCHEHGGRGENRLGEMLMDLRAVLQAEDRRDGK
jgi:ribA/ribD-fused uncharacterized protein